MKKVKLIVSILLATLMLLTCIPLGVVKVNAASTYNPDAALAYAKANLYDDDEGLCARFVSNCLKAGGFTAVYNVNAKALGQQLQNYGTKITCTGWSSKSCLKASMFNSALSKGDVIIWENKTGASASGHAMLYSGETNSKGEILVYARNDVKNKEIIMPSSSASTVYAIHLASEPHSSHSYTEYVWFEAAHPHYKAYKCSCGDVQRNTSEPTFYDLCSECMTFTSINSGTYFIRNKATGTYMDVANSIDANNSNIELSPFNGSTSQQHAITYSGNEALGFAIQPKCSSTRVVNGYGNTINSGANVCLWDNTGHSSQRWYFQSVSGGYLIRNVQNPYCVLSVRNVNDVYVSTYTGVQNQIWILEKECASQKHIYTNDADTTCNNCNAVAYPGGNTLIKEGNTWYHIVNRQKVSDTTLVQYNGVWYYVNKGKVDFSATTLVKYNNKWWYVKAGKMARDNTLVKYNGVWYHVNGGNITTSTTLVKYSGSWYYVKDGKMNTSDTLVKYNNVWYHVNGGKWVKDNTLVNYSGSWYYVKDGKMNTSNTLVKYNGSWYHVNGGKMVKDTTLVKYSGKWYYVKNGVVDFKFNGRVLYSGKYYTVKNGVKI